MNACLRLAPISNDKSACGNLRTGVEPSRCERANFRKRISRYLWPDELNAPSIHI